MTPRTATQNFERFQDLILERCGIALQPQRWPTLSRSISALARDSGCRNLEEFFRLLLGSGTKSKIWGRLIAKVSVGETYFFRDQTQIEALRRHILPDIIARRRDEKRLRVWSAGCATGEEPYSLAILLRQILPDINSWQILILATDINSKALEQASRGRYSEWSFRNTGPELRGVYFTPYGKRFEICPKIREMVTYAYLNLAEDSYPALPTNTNSMDLILCRNVGIYHPEKVTREIADRFHRSLTPEGWLMVGAVEANGVLYSSFTTRSFSGATAYQKTARVPDGLNRPYPPDQVLKPPPVVTGAAYRPTGPPAQTRPWQGIPLSVQVPGETARPAATPEDAFEAGATLMEQGRYQEAAEFYQALLGEASAPARVRYHIARAMANMGLLEDAEVWCQQAIESNPLSAEAHYTLALIHVEEGRLEEAIEGLKRVLYLEADFVLAHFSLANTYRQKGLRAEAARHRTNTVRAVSKMSPEEKLPGADGLTAGQLMTMVRATA